MDTVKGYSQSGVEGSSSSQSPKRALHGTAFEDALNQINTLIESKDADANQKNDPFFNVDLFDVLHQSEQNRQQKVGEQYNAQAAEQISLDGWKHGPNQDAGFF